MESDKVDLSLDEIIKRNRIGRGRGRGGRRNGGRGASRGTGGASFVPQNTGRSAKFGQRRNNNFVRGTPRGRGVVRGGIIKRSQNNRNFVPRNVEGVWTHDLFQGVVTNTINTRSEGKLLISNLDYGVSDSDMKELFSDFGLLKKAAVHYDFSGRSLGTAEVIFASRQDAVKAMNQYNTVPLDGRPMKIQIVGDAPSVRSRLQRGVSNRARGNQRQNVVARNFNATRGTTRGVRNMRGRGGRGGRRGGRGGRVATSLTKEQLDEQLDNYNKMDIN